MPDDIVLRTNARKNKLSREDEFLTDDQILNGAINDIIKDSDMKAVIERYNENLQSTSSSPKILQRTFNLGFPYKVLAPPPVKLDIMKKKNC